MRTVICRTAGVILLVLGALGATGSLKVPEWVDDASAEQAIADQRAADMQRLSDYAADLTRQIGLLEERMDRAEGDAISRSEEVGRQFAALFREPNLEAMGEATVFVETDLGHGSGVIVGTRWIMTSAHVIREAESIEVEFIDGSRIEAELVWLGATNEENDIAVLALSEPAPYASAPLSCATLHAGDRLISFGNPLAGRWVSAELRVASDRAWGKRIPNSVTVQGPLVSGNSGGPVFNEQGEVVALVQAMFLMPIGFSASTTGFGAVYPMSSICDALPAVARGGAL